ncbi:23S rRNA (uracil(1939)-C(5))-methyltransferase RlmD [Lachnoclostridium sp. Marseille-P6806]|uniref:23S rRNA (uracil(1939)-C(5))-methyltransferase RlmD n=1 Tax=Lachnoclostridium sp. Marseille-P6806 TaxID=2364793 RepID=UPI002ED52DE5
MSGKRKNTPVQKDDILHLTIEDIGNDGEGIGHVVLPAQSGNAQPGGMQSGGARFASAESESAGAEQGKRYTVFVKDAVVGDTVTAAVMKAAPGYAYARLLSVDCPSPDRVEASCPIARQCGGCQLQTLRYEKQLAFKQKKVRGNLLRLGSFAPALLDRVMRPIVGMEEPFRYRNKAQVPLGTDRSGKPVAGFYAGRTHSIVPMTDCLLGDVGNDRILRAVLDYMQEEQVPAYDEKSGRGLLRHVLIRTGLYSREIMVCLVVNGKTLPAEERLVERLRTLPGVAGISLNCNEARGNVILGKTLRVIWGAEAIRDSLRVFAVEDMGAESREGLTEREEAGDGAGSDIGSGAGLASGVRFVSTGERVDFRISPLSFYQVNPKQTEKLYSLVLDFAGLTGKETVWDLYCGIGTISLFLARRAGKVYGVEVIPEAIRDARENARLNGICNVQFEVGRAEEVLPRYVERHREEYREHPVDVIVVDPPRRGLDDVTIATCLAMAPKRIVYVSCDSATLARDLAKLTRGQRSRDGEEYRYELERVQAVDQFGQTVHVETVVLLSHKAPDSHINVKVEFGEGKGKVPLDKIAERAEKYKAKEKVTYKMI